jgi:hypothetical protein
MWFATSRIIEGVICEEQGACKHKQCPLLHSAKARGLAALVLTQRGPENKQLPLRTPASSCISSHRLPVILLMPGEGERKRGEKGKIEKTMDRISLADLYSTCWGRLRC